MSDTFNGVAVPEVAAADAFQGSCFLKRSADLASYGQLAKAIRLLKDREMEG